MNKTRSDQKADDVTYVEPMGGVTRKRPTPGGQVSLELIITYVSSSQPIFSRRTLLNDFKIWRYTKRKIILKCVYLPIVQCKMIYDNNIKSKIKWYLLHKQRYVYWGFNCKFKLWGLFKLSYAFFFYFNIFTHMIFAKNISKIWQHFLRISQHINVPRHSGWESLTYMLLMVSS